MTPEETLLHRLNQLCEQAMHEAEQAGLNPAAFRIIGSVDTLDGSRATAIATGGAGNWHAQMGSVEDWLEGERQYAAAYHQQRGRNDMDDQGDL